MKIAEQVRTLETKIRKLEMENKLLKDKLRSGWVKLKINPKREKIRKYVEANPGATIRQIKDSCKISSTSVVFFHLSRLKLEKINEDK